MRVNRPFRNLGLGMKKILALTSNNTEGTSQIVEGGCYHGGTPLPPLKTAPPRGVTRFRAWWHAGGLIGLINLGQIFRRLREATGKPIR